MSEFTSPTPIRADHDVAAFDCGKPPLNEFLQQHALDKQNAKLSRTYVVVRDAVVAAYYTLAYVSISQAETPKKFGRGMPHVIPAMLMARLAVDRTAQGRGLGRSLLTDALRRTWAVMESGAAPVRLFMVDAKDDEAKAFYDRYDLTPSPQHPMRLFLFYKDLKLIYADKGDEL
jgi:GNAT superfamily N-acetyltransferase